MPHNDRSQSSCAELRPRLAFNDVAMLRENPSVALDALASLDEPAALTVRVRALLTKEFYRSLPSREQVAQSLHLSVAALHRQLQIEGTSFQHIKGECRQRKACELLADSSLTIENVAELTGFSGAAAFHKAFRRWMGETPADYRRKLGGSSSPAAN